MTIPWGIILHCMVINAMIPWGIILHCMVINAMIPWSIILHCMVINAIMVWYMRIDYFIVSNNNCSKAAYVPISIVPDKQSIFMSYCARQGMGIIKGV